MKIKHLKKIAYLFKSWHAKLIQFFIINFLYSGLAQAVGGDGSTQKEGIAKILGTVQKDFVGIENFMRTGAKVAGVGFMLASFFKFKAHKDNPTQIPIGTPLALLFIGAALLGLHFITLAGMQTLFGASADSDFGDSW